MLILIILLFLFKKKYFIINSRIKRNLINRNKVINKKNLEDIKIKNSFIYQEEKVYYSAYERFLLIRQMKTLFKGNKNEKIKALNIAKNLYDRSSLNLLKKGLKDMDSEIVQISANLIDIYKR